MAISRFVYLTDAVLKYETCFCHFFTYVIVLKQLFTSGSVIIVEYSPTRWRVAFGE